MAARSLRISTSNEGKKNFLTKDTKLILTFQVLDPQALYKDQFPVAWKVLTVSSNTEQTLPDIKYTAKLGVAVAGLDDGQLVSGGAKQQLTLGKKTVVTRKDDAYHWSLPVPINSDEPDQGAATATNKTNEEINLCIGTYSVANKFEPVLFFQAVSVDTNVAIELTPMMRVYSAANYQETKIMRAEEQTFLGEWNLSKLKGSKTAEFTIFSDSERGGKLTFESDQDAIVGVKTA